MAEEPKPRPKFQRGIPLEHQVGMGKLAEYDGRCPLCGDDIDAGISFIRYDDLEDGWVHTYC